MKNEMVKELNDESKKMKKVLNDESKGESLAEKVIDLCLWYQIEDSHNMIKLFESEIKFHEIQKDAILSKCTFGFQRKKISKEVEEIDKRILELNKYISEELVMIEKMEGSIERNNDSNDGKENENIDDFISYYDLLSYLKYGITFKKVSLNEFDKNVIYIYDNEGNYIINDKKYVGDQFTTYLSEFSSDVSKFKKNIKIVEK